MTIKFPSKHSADSYRTKHDDPLVYLVYTGNARQSGKYLYLLKELTALDNGKAKVVVVNLDKSRKLEKWKLEVKNINHIPFASVNDLFLAEARDMFTESSFERWVEEIKELKKIRRQEINKFTGNNKNTDHTADATSFAVDTSNEYVKPKEESKMSKMTRVKDKNVDAAKMAASQAAGKILNKTIKDKVKPHLPMMVRGYADHALADVVIANVFAFIADNYLKGETQAKAQFASDAMLQAAMVDLVASFNLEKLVEDVLSNVELPTVGAETE